MTDHDPSQSGSADDGDERALALRYAPPAERAALSALLALDARLAGILQTTREVLIGQMRLTWWHEALVALDRAAPPAEPVLESLARYVLPHVSGATLSTLVEGWEALLDPVLDDTTLQTHAECRGDALFTAMAARCDLAGPFVAPAGRGWALADIAHHLSDERLRARARAMARAELHIALEARWPARARAIGALAHLAAMDVADHPRPSGHPARAARLLWHRLSGR